MATPRLYFTLNQAQDRLRKYADGRCLAETGASSAQLGATFYIGGHQPCSQADIAGAFGQDESAATGMLRPHAERRVHRAHPRADHRAAG